MSDEQRLAILRSGHTEVGGGICGECDEPWPCDTGVVLEQLAEERMHRDELSVTVDALRDVIALRDQQLAALRGAGVQLRHMASLMNSLALQGESVSPQAQTILHSAYDAWNRALLAPPAGEPPKPHRRDPYAACAILAGHLRDWHDEQHSGAWQDCQENECAETRGIVGDTA